MNKQTSNNTQERTERKIELKATAIKLGIDVHKDSYRVVRQVDGATPQPAQKFRPQEFMKWAAKQLLLAQKVYSCYEAGPFGYGLHRDLSKLGITNIVVRPQNWDELGKGVKTDKSDALALVQRLDRYVGGNQKAFAVVRVPSAQQQAQRAVSRQRDQLLEHRKRMEAQGRSLLLFNAIGVSGRWWTQSRWKQLSGKLSNEIKEILDITQELIIHIDQKLQQVTARITAQAQAQPLGLGALTSEILNREIKDWNLFSNRRSIASIGGVCPGVHSSGEKRRMGSITKHGNPRIRAALIEAVWRLTRYQPEYGPIKKRSSIFSNPLATSTAKKKAVVAIGRQLLIDLWRINTGRTTVQEVGLKMVG